MKPTEVPTFFVFIAVGVSTVLFAVSAVGTYFIFADHTDARVAYLNKESHSPKDAQVNTQVPARITLQIASTLKDTIPCFQDSCWHVGIPYQFIAQCVDGSCECNSHLYNNTTCLQSAVPCQDRKEPHHIHAVPYSSLSTTLTVYNCAGPRGTGFDVHVLGVYEGNVNTRPTSAGRMNVEITSSPISSRPVVLVLTNYEPVEWVLDFPSHLTIDKVILIAYYSDLSSVTSGKGIARPLEVDKRPRGTPRGFGNDIGGGRTAEMLLNLREEFGAVTSLAGTYRADSWIWNLPPDNNAI